MDSASFFGLLVLGTMVFMPVINQGHVVICLYRNTEAEMIEEVAKEVSNMLNKSIPSWDFDRLVGIENHIRQISSLLSLDSDDVRMVGIWGPAGIGKTTIARAFYREISDMFMHTAFVESIRGSRENQHRDDHTFKLHLQEQLLSKTFKHKDLKIHHLGVAEARLKGKKVLVVLDDVDDLRQLKAMAEKTQWFGRGSRIIITSRYKHLLKAYGIENTYHVELPCSSEALEIFCLSAFDQKSPKAGFEELSMEIRGLAGNLPLGLNVYGSYMRGMSKEEWMHALPKLRTSLDGNIEMVLMLSYNSLCDHDKDLFLHIACFFIGEKTNNLEEDFSNLDEVRRGLQVLLERSLISIDKGARLVIHNFLEQLGIEITRKEYRYGHGRRKFLVDALEICDVLADSTVSGSVLGANFLLTEIEDKVSTDGDKICDVFANSTVSGSVLGTNLLLTEIEDKVSIDGYKSIPFNYSWTHDVFPSFFGPDVRRSLLGHMLKELSIKGITPFIDNEIQRGMSIGPELIRALRGSKILIVLISKNYASSMWCLKELVEIMKCREELGQTVIPIFYEVDPTDVKKLRGYFGAVFKKTCVGKSVDDVKRWKYALAQVATLAGYYSRNWKNEADMVERVAKDIADRYMPSREFDTLVGMENHVTQISSLLSLDSDDVRMVGIWGPAGIGKSTIARVLYSIFFSNFTHTAFMPLGRQITNKHADDHAFKLHLQKQLLRQTFNQDNLEIYHLGVAKERLKDKKVLVILDDVDDLRQLEAMAGKTQWFGPGSRIIITATDKHLFKAHRIDHIYHVDFPCSSEALEIFCLSAFDQKSPYVGFEELTMEIIRLAGNLPLGLNVYGSYMRGMAKDEWMHALPKLKTGIDREIEGILMHEYERLCDEDKDLFIHIACFFNGKKSSILSKYIRTLDVAHGLQVLVEKSLISIDKDERLVMHNLLEMMGKEIASKEYIDVHERKDAREVSDDTETFESVENITCEGIAVPSISHSPLPFSCSHQVFPSFCGVDVRKAFLPQMLKEFRSIGITPFIDNEIQRGMSIGPELKEAIKGSRISIVIISKNYASSTWCLEELVAIMKCREEWGQIVMTIFYEVEPTDVKKQTGSFGSVFKETCVGKPGEAVEKWKKALEEVAQIAGYDSSSWRNETDMIEKVAIDVANKLNKATPSRDFDGLVGMNNHITQISSLLSLDSDDVRMVGIWGHAGIGKTTIARALYWKLKLSKKFTHTAFMESVRGSRENKHSDDHEFKLHLQEQLLLKDKKVLVVLDDVDDLRQLEAMSGKTQWFGHGSRIIITTRDTYYLKAHGIDNIY
ncbi:unnamed protein product, partial [Brassica oleracea var. botrytis]